MNQRLSSFVRSTSVILMSLVAVFNIMGGVGTICVSFAPQNWPPFRALLQMQWLYVSTTILTLVLGVAAANAAYALLRGERWAYLGSLATLVIGASTVGIRMYYSLQLRGGYAPSHIRFYVTLFVLAWFLAVRLPAIWNRIDLTRPVSGGSHNIPAGIACVAAGLGALAYPWMAGSSHVVDGVNLVHVLQPQINIIGAGLLIMGTGLLALARSPYRIEELVARFRRSSQLTAQETKGGL